MANDEGEGRRRRSSSLEVRAERLVVGDERYPEHRFVLDYWQGLRGQRVGPKRGEVDPVALRTVLPRITLVDYDAARDGFRFRLAGTDLYGLQHREITRCDVDEIQPWEYMEILNAHYAEVIATGQPNAFRFVFSTRDGLRRDYATLRVPLSEDGTNVSGIMTVDCFCNDWEALELYFDALHDRE